MTNKKFPWGRVIDIFTFDFEGDKLEITKFHPHKHNEYGHQVFVNDALTGQKIPVYETFVYYHSDKMSSSASSLDGLIIAYIAYKRLGLNEHSLVTGICRALNIPA